MTIIRREEKTFEGFVVVDGEKKALFRRTFWWTQDKKSCDGSLADASICGYSNPAVEEALKKWPE